MPTVVTHASTTIITYIYFITWIYYNANFRNLHRSINENFWAFWYLYCCNIPKKIIKLQRFLSPVEFRKTDRVTIVVSDSDVVVVDDPWLALYCSVMFGISWVFRSFRLFRLHLLCCRSQRWVNWRRHIKSRRDQRLERWNNTAKVETSIVFTKNEMDWSEIRILVFSFIDCRGSIKRQTLKLILRVPQRILNKQVRSIIDIRIRCRTYVA